MAIQIIKDDNPSAPIFENNAYKRLGEVIISSLYIPAAINAVLFIFHWSVGGFVMGTFFMAMIYGYFKIIAFNMKVVATGDRKEFDKVHEYYKALATQQGIQVSYESPGIIVDDIAKKIVFTIDPAQETKAIICDYNDVRRWYGYRNKLTETTRSRYSSSTETLLTAYGVRVEINYAEQPLYGFWVSDQNDSDRWVARLSSLIKG